MTLFAKPETVACPQCDWYFARPVLHSYNTFKRKVYSDGGASDSIESYIPNVGRCPSCNLVIHNINDLAAIAQPLQLSWMRRCWAKLCGQQLSNEYDYLHQPNFSDYAELFATANSLEDKRNWAVLACRAYHQAYCLPEQSETADNQQGDNSDNEPSKASRVLYQDLSDFVLGNPMEPVLDEYTLICADILRMRGDFGAAILAYHKVKNPELDHVVEQGHIWCVERNAKLMVLKL